MPRFAILAFLLLMGAAAFAEDPAPADPALRKQIAGWLQDLRADAYETRRAAREQLRVHGRRAPDLLEALADDPDAEVRRTVRELLGPGWTRPREAPPVMDLAALAQVEVPASVTSLRDALDRIGRDVGARIELPLEHPDTLRLDEPVAGPFFQVLSDLARRGGLAQPPSFDAAGVLALEKREPGRLQVPEAAAGPLAIRVLEVTATRSLASRALPRYRLELLLCWAPSVQVTQLSAPRLVSAHDASRCTFSDTAGRSTTTYGVGSTQTARQVYLGLRPDDAACREQLAELVIEVPGLRMRAGARQVRFDGLDALPQAKDGTGAAVEAGASGAIELRAIHREGDDRRRQYVVELAGRFASAVARDSARVFVTWSDGREQRLHIMGGRSVSADGLLNLTVRAWPRGDAHPAAIRVHWYEREVSGALRFRLSDVPLR